MHDLAPERGLMLAVMDPCGITRDLARLMQFEVQTFLTRPEAARPLAVSQAIISLRAAVQQQAVQHERDAAQQLRQQQYAHESAGFVLDDVLDVFDDRDWADQRRRRINDAFELTDASEKQVRDKAWRAKYGTKYSEPAREKFQTQWDADFVAFDQRIVQPLARAHCAWLTGESLANYFEGHFSTVDAASGFAYQQVFTLCIEDCSDKLACLNQLQAWVKGRVTDEKNLFLRALALNNDAFAAKVAAAADSELSLDELPWDALSDTLKEAVLASPKLNGDFAARMGRSSSLAPLLTNAGAGLVKALSAPDSAGMRWATQAMLLMGLGSGRKIVTLQLSGSRKEFRAMILAALMNAQADRAGSLNADRMKGAINREVGRLEAEGKLNGRQSGQWYLLLDEHQLAEAKLDDVRRAALDKRLGRLVVSREAIERLTRRNVARAVSSEVRWGAVALVLQLVNLNKVIKDNESAMAHERLESRYKLAAAAATAAGTLTELVAEAVKGKGWGRVPVMRGTELRPLQITRWRMLSIFGKGVGAVAGMVVAVFDFLDARQAFENKRPGLTVLYSASAGIGVFLSIALGFGWLSGPLGVLIACLLMGLLLVITLMLEILKNNKLQDWLERCYFGVDFRSRGYDSFEMEMRELNLAIK